MTHPLTSRRILLLLGTASLLSAVSCGDKEQPATAVGTPAATASAAASAGPDGAPADGTFASNVVNDAMGPFKRDLDGNSPDAHLRALNAALTFWLAAGRPFPKDLYELAAAKLIPRVPAPPPGQRFVLDRAGNQVLLAPGAN